VTFPRGFLLGSVFGLWAVSAAADPVDPFRAGAVADRKGDLKAAAEEFADAARRRPHDPRGRGSLRRTLMREWEAFDKARQIRRRDYVREARRRWEASLGKRKEWSARCREARRKIRQKKFEEASDILNRVLDASPGFPAARRGLERVQRKGKSRLAKGRFLSPRHARALEGVLAYNDGEWEKAFALLDESTAEGPPAGLEAARLPEYRARAAARWQEIKDAAERDDQFARGVRAYDDGRFDEAREIFRGIVERRPSDRESLGYLKALDSLLDRVDENVESRLRREEIEKRLLRANLLFARENYLESLEELARVLELDPSHPHARQQARDIKRLMDRQALFVPEFAIEDESERKFREGLRFYGDADYAEALAAFEEALRLNPGHRDAELAVARVRQILENASGGRNR
jgi:tetratricopeptide (TPR) repeat protein